MKSINIILSKTLQYALITDILITTLLQTQTTYSIALGLLSFIPYVGPTILGVAGIIETGRNLVKHTFYVAQKVYCKSDYSNYAYKNYFYSYSNHFNLIELT